MLLLEFIDNFCFDFFLELMEIYYLSPVQLQIYGIAQYVLCCPVPRRPLHSLLHTTDGGAGLLLPPALEVFPYEVEPLLSLATALAAANPDSCLKVCP